MTTYRHNSVCCPNCNTTSKYNKIDSINVTLNPELKEKMENLELFTWVCPNCGKKYIVQYPFLYHDMQRGIMQYLSIDYSDKLREQGYSGAIKPFDSNTTEYNDLIKEIFG